MIDYLKSKTYKPKNKTKIYNKQTQTNMQCFGYRTSQETNYKNLHPISTTHVLTLLLLLIHLSSRTPYITPPEIQIVNISPDTSTIQAVTSYTISFQRNDTSPNLPTGSYMEITFPQEYLNRIVFTTSPRIDCVSEELSSPMMYCTLTGYLVKVWNAFAVINSAKRFTLTINNIANPSPARDYQPFTVKLYQPDGTLLQQQSIPSPPLTTTPGLASCSITATTNNLVFTRGSLLITYSSPYITSPNSSYKMHISMDSFYTDDPLSTLINPVIAGYTTLGNIGGKYTFQVNYTTSINITMLFPPSTKGVEDFIFVESYIDGLGGVDQCYMGIDSVQSSSMSIEVDSSSFQVQQQSTYSFTILPSSPIFPGDSLILQFPTSYDISAVTSATFLLGVFGVKTITKSGNTITIPNVVYTYIQSKSIKFNISLIVNPFDCRGEEIVMRTVTSDGYVRDEGRVSVTIGAGELVVNGFTCGTYQIGAKTACKLNFTLPNAIKLDSQVRVIFPQASWMLSLSGSNTQCQTESPSSQLKSLFQCRYYSNKTFVLSKFTDWTNITRINGFTAEVTFEQSSIDVDHRLQLPWEVGTFAFVVGSYTSDGYAIDSGSFTMNTTKRQLTETDGNAISFQKAQTLTPSKLYILYTLPYDKAVSYTLRVHLPLDLSTDASSITSSYGTVMSFDTTTSSLLLNLTDVTALTRNITITGFKTCVSTRPVSLAVEMLYQNVVYFYYSSSVAVDNPKQVSTLAVVMSSPVVYELNDVTMTISELSNGDVLVYSTTDYPSFLTTTQTPTSCTPSTITCNIDGSLTILGANNADPSLKLTRFAFPIRNAPFVGKPTFSLTVYDQTRTYLKQRSTFLLDVSMMAAIPVASLAYTSSNPYFREVTTLTVSFGLSTPGASRVVVTLPGGYAYTSSKCTKNCGDSAFSTATNTFQATLSGNDVKVEFVVTNPSDFTESIGITSKDSLLRSMEYGQLRIERRCTSPCRSCEADNTSQCLSCYNFNLNNTLSGSKCLTQCAESQYQLSQSSLLYCYTCPSSCTACTSPTTCQQCSPSFIYFNSTCLSTCPSKHFASASTAVNTTTSTKECLPCTSPCQQCTTTATFCLSCVSGSYLYQNSCRQECPVDWFVVGRECVHCTGNCAVCQNQTAACLQCQNGFYLYSGVCYVQCPVAGMVKNATSGKCETCPSGCRQCGEYVTQCEQCVAGMFLFNGTCLASCEAVDGYFSNTATQSCDTCRDPCKQCSSSAIYCESCVAGKYIYNHECFTTCPDGTYQSTNQSTPHCIACQWPCTKCSDSSSCSSCGSPYALNASTCVSSCGPSSFVNSLNQCETCPTKCKTCNITGCLECSNSAQFLLDQSCVTSCSPLYKNEQSMVCESCRNPCETCTTNSTLCGSCIDEYSLMESTSICYKTCPPLYFSQNSYCKLCSQGNPSCKECALSSNDFTCSSCMQATYFYGYVCIDSCPQNYTLSSNSICTTRNCTHLPDCQLCSDTRCLTCRSLYTLQANTCTFKPISAISNLPLPFPFLILTLLTILSGFVLKWYFNTMYVPLYLYAVCGMFEVGCVALWTLLAVLTSWVNLEETLVNWYFATLLIVAVYAGFNVLAFVGVFCVLKGDRRFSLWERQDNRSGSIVVSLVSLIVTFRFYMIKFSKLGNREIFSATLQTPQNFTYLTILPTSSILLISLPTTLLASYLAYLQHQMNYLFFTCIQTVIISVIMIILAVMAVLTPKDYLLQKKDEYRMGYDSEQMEGKSMNQLLCAGVVEEQHYEGQSLGETEGGERVGGQQEQVDQVSLEDNAVGGVVIGKNTKGNTKDNPLLQQEHSRFSGDENRSQSLISFHHDITKALDKEIELDDRQRITQLLENTLLQKQLILDQIIRQQHQEIIEQVNGRYLEEENDEEIINDDYRETGILPKGKQVGTIVKQFVKKQEQYEEENEEISDIGEQILFEEEDDDKASIENDGEQLSLNSDDQNVEMSSSTMLKGRKATPQKRKAHKKPQKLKSHQSLTLDQQTEFILAQQKRQNIATNLQTIENIKRLSQLLSIKEQQEKLLRQKLSHLNSDLSSLEYIKIRERIERNNMSTEDKLSRLGEMYGRRKEQRDRRRKSRKVVGGQHRVDQQKPEEGFVLDREEIEEVLRDNQNYGVEFVYEPEESKIQENMVTTIKVRENAGENGREQNQIQSNQGKGHRSNRRMPDKIKLVTKNHINGNEEEIVDDQKRQITYPNNQENNQNNQKLISAQKIEQKPQQPNPITNSSDKAPMIGKKIPKKVISASIPRRTNLQPITQQDQRSPNLHNTPTNDHEQQQQSPTSLPINSFLHKRNHQSPNKLTNNEEQTLIDDQPQDVQFQQEEHKSNASWHEHQRQSKARATPLLFAQPLEEDQPGRVLEGKKKGNKEGGEINGELEGEEKEGPKIEYCEGPIETMEEEYDHWPIDPQLKQKILDIQLKANSYLSSGTRRASKSNHPTRNLTHTHTPIYTSHPHHSLINYSSQNLTSIPRQHIQSRHLTATQSNNKFESRGDLQQQENDSIFQGPRESEVDFVYPRGEMLVFEDDEEFGGNYDQEDLGQYVEIDEHELGTVTANGYRRDRVLLEEEKMVNIEIDPRGKVSKKRVNRNIIDLRPDDNYNNKKY